MFVGMEHSQGHPMWNVEKEMKEQEEWRELEGIVGAFGWYKEQKDW
jgi:hypothetical protein